MGFEQLWHILGNLEGHVHVHGFACTQERPEQALITHYQWTLSLCADRK